MSKLNYEIKVAGKWVACTYEQAFERGKSLMSAISVVDDAWESYYESKQAENGLTLRKGR